VTQEMMTPPAWIDQAALKAAQEIERETMDYWPVERRIAFAQSVITKVVMAAAPCPICNKEGFIGLEGCEHTLPERLREQGALK